ncbi:toll/interleukin-1 receptor domain-containing protein [Mycobacterium sp. Y57]|nr:toll/interleukin-1 receptor domain-containing protein [Mycolicibacterium xanthum]
MATAPRGFMSYSHDDDEHKDWVLQLASRLRGNGVDVCLDRWDVSSRSYAASSTAPPGQ